MLLTDCESMTVGVTKAAVVMPQKNIFDLSGFFSDLTTSNLKVRLFNKATADVTATQSSVVVKQP